MIKTMKPAEAKIFFDKTDGILLDYLQHMSEQPDSLLSKVLGVYQIQIKHSEPVFFFVSENMVGDDFEKIRHMYDLKGSTLSRHTQLTTEEQQSGTTGVKVLKDQNMIDNKSKLQIHEA